MIRFLCSVFIAITVLKPLTSFRLPDNLDFSDYKLEAEAARLNGENLSRQARADIIKQRTEAYIQDKAAEIGLTIQTEVILDTDDIMFPETVLIHGAYTEEQKEALSACIERELAVAREKQIWNRSN